MHSHKALHYVWLQILTSPLVTGTENLPNPGAVVFSVVFQLSSSASPNTLFILGWVSLFLWFHSPE